MRRFLFVVCLLTSHFQFEVTSAIDTPSPAELSDLVLKELGFEFEVMLKLFLRDWHFLTETGNITDVGEVFLKENLSSAKEPLSDTSRCGREISCQRMKGNNDLHSQALRFLHQKHHQAIRFPRETQNDSPQKSVVNIASEGIVGDAKYYHQDVVSLENASGIDGSHSTDGEFDLSRHVRDSSAKVPIIYMPGDKKKRKCADVNGMLAGFNTFNYLTFVTGVITLVLNINNNINNNNNNNNLNNNNDLSNNNVNSNTNTQNANQVVIFPPGRKKRSIADWVLQMLSSTKSESLPRRPEEGRKQSAIATTCMLSDIVFPLLEAFDAWTEGSTADGGECGWKHYCEVQLKYSRRSDEASAVLSQSLRWVSNLVSAPFSSSSECYFLIARCHNI